MCVIDWNILHYPDSNNSEGVDQFLHDGQILYPLVPPLSGYIFSMASNIVINLHVNAY
jgi:hypothetical protein